MLMNPYNEGDKLKALCSYCKKKVDTTFKIRTFLSLINDTEYKIPFTLVSVCDTCNNVVSIPQQSVKDVIKAMYERR